MSWHWRDVLGLKMVVKWKTCVKGYFLSKNGSYLTITQGPTLSV